MPALTTSATIHEWLLQYNFDNGLEPLWSVVESPETELATALLIYWRLNGPWLHDDETEVNQVARTMANRVRERLTAAEYRTGMLRFDPVADMDLNRLQIVRLLRSGIPKALIEPSWSESE